ncbi:alginate O-acetyltransferase [Marinobacter sp.]|uniref:alginate O-acetyltransferase n=1 Tax=Marinobacter sp. TaxID=50741 RepID=UPI003A94E32E
MTKAAAILTACLFIALVLVLGVLSVRPLLGYEAQANLNLVNGEWARELEGHYDDQFPVRDLGTNLWAAINYSLFEEGRLGVVVGRQGWLFSEEEFYPAELGGDLVARNLERVTQVSQYLRARGIPLVVLVVPAKARIYSEKLAGTNPEAVMASLYDRFLSNLASAKVAAPDLAPALEQAQRDGQRVFLRTDTHWTPVGADLFARHAATFIRERFPQQSWGEQTFITSVEEPVTHRGDLLTYIPVAPAFTEFGPTPDQLKPRTTEEAAKHSANANANALFGGSTAETVLVGTSYSANRLWNFPGALRQHLGRDLINVADEGQGPIQPMTDYLQSSDFRDQPPQLVIWEFPERYLAQPVESEQALSWFRQVDKLLAATSGRSSETNP